MRRVLVAILSADVVGYSRLTGRDPEGTVARLHALREMIATTVAVEGGRVFGVAGDSEMAAFEAESAALRAALAIQREVAGQNARRAKKDVMALRIGLGYGRVIRQGGDLYGDDVNIAARVMALAGAGEITMTEAFFRLVEHDAPCGVVSLGRHQLKNIRRPIRVYKVIPRSAVLPRLGAYARRARHGRPLGLAGLGVAAAGIVMAALVPLRADLMPWLHQGAEAVGLERYIWTAERRSALALGDAEWQLAERWRLEAEAAARRRAEAYLAEALARAEAEAAARQDAERLVRVAEARALTAEEERQLAEQLARMARKEAEALSQARAAAEGHRLAAEAAAASAREEAERADAARAAAESLARAAAGLAAEAQEDAAAARQALQEQLEAAQSAADKLSTIVTRLRPPRPARGEARQAEDFDDADGGGVVSPERKEDPALQLAALPSAADDVEPSGQGDGDNVAALLRDRQDILIARLRQYFRANDEKNEARHIGANRGRIDIEDLQVLDSAGAVHLIRLRYRYNSDAGLRSYVGDDLLRIRLDGEDIEILSRGKFDGQRAPIESPEISSPLRDLPGTIERLQVALDSFMRPNPPPQIKPLGINLNTRIYLYGAEVLMANSPVYRIAMNYTLRTNLANHNQNRNDVFIVHWDDEKVEVLEWAGPYEPVVARPEESWPPPPSDRALLALEQRLWQGELSLEWEIAANVSGVQEARLIDLRALGQTDTTNAVLIQFDGTWSTTQLPSQTLVFDISMASGSPEVLGYRDYVAAEWPAAEVDG